MDDGFKKMDDGFLYELRIFILSLKKKLGYSNWSKLRVTNISNYFFGNNVINRLRTFIIWMTDFYNMDDGLL